MLKALTLLSLLVVASYAGRTENQYQVEFTRWMQENKKSYHHDEFLVRYSVFKTNLAFIDEHNSKNLSFTVAMNKFGDLTIAEFSKYYLGLKKEVTYEPKASSAPAAPLPAAWNWNTKGKVTPIKDQQQCGSCWAFSTTGSTEGCHAITKNKLVSISEQQLVDCSGSYGNQGCNGGLMTQAMQYIIDNKGLDTESSYPYTAQDGSCAANPKNIGATLTGFTNVNAGDESDLQQKVYKGPTSIAIDASQSSFQFYSSGVYFDPNCSSQQLDHGVLAVGWGVTSGSYPKYWIVKNSWGTGWGQSGFIWMARDQSNACGVATMATLPQC